MRTNIELNDQLVKEAMLATNIKTKKHLVEYALKEVIKNGKRRNILKYYSKVEWEGDLNKMREI